MQSCARSARLQLVAFSLLGAVPVAHGAAATFALRALSTAALQRSSHLLMSAVVVPTPPAPFVSLDRHSAFLDDILKLEAEISARHEGRTAAFACARAVQNAASLALHRRHAGDATGAAAKLSEAADGLALLLPHRGEGEEDAGLSAAIQQVCVCLLYTSPSPRDRG